MQWSQLSVAETSVIGIMAAFIWIVYTVVTLRRMGSKEGGLRSTLLAIALICFCLLLYQPQYPVDQLAGKALLLTESTLSVPDSLPVFALPGVQAQGKITVVPDLATLERNHPEISQIYIAGYGLEPEQLLHLERLQVVFLEKEIPAGINWLNYTRQVNEGEPLKISGTYTNTTADAAKLSLATVEGIQDSIVLPPGTKSFSLQASANIAGKFIGAVRIMQGDSIRSEPLPYVVESRKPLQIILLQAFPSFEMNYLKDWLAAQQHRIQLRARISQDKYSTQRINYETGSKILPILSEKNLNEADVLITDAGSLRQMAASEQKRLQQAVEQGLGLLLFPDEDWLRKPEVLGQRFMVKTSRENQFVPAVQQAAEPGVKAEKLLFSFPESRLLVPLIYSRAQEIIAAYLPMGKGRIGAQLAAVTFPWLLQGEGRIYSSFWADIIQAASRRKPQNKLHISGIPFIWEKQKANISLSDTALLPVTVRADSGSRQLAMPEMGLLSPFESSYQFQPVTAGWIQLHAGEDSSQVGREYVLPASAWPDLKRAGWWRKNMEQAADEPTQTNNRYTAKQEVALLWFFLPFLAATSLLWWREKAGVSMVLI